jgi:hypothetical protein
MVQRARMLHDAEAVPSQTTAVYWIEAKPSRESPAPTVRAGAWIMETTAQEVDALWAVIKDATRAGSLGYKSKVATASHTGSPNARVMHVCTVDGDDAADVERVRQALVELNAVPARYQRGAS